MNLRWIEDFLALCETGSFSAAAQRRFLTQSALSKRIKALEDYLGSGLLFDRSITPIVPTKSGEIFRHRAQQIVALVNLARREAADSTKSTTNIYVSSLHVLSSSVFSAIAHLLSQSDEGICLRIVANNFRESIAIYENAECDLLLCYNYQGNILEGFLTSADHLMLPLGTDYLVPVSVPKADGTPLHALNTEEDVEIPYLDYAGNTYLGTILKSHPSFMRVAPYLRKTGESTYAASLRAGVVNALGIAWLPLLLVEDDLHNGKLTLAGDATADCIPLRIELYRRRDVVRQEVANIWELLQSELNMRNSTEVPELPLVLADA